MLLLQYTLTFSRKRNAGEVGSGEEKGKQPVPRMRSTGHVCQMIFVWSSGTEWQEDAAVGKTLSFAP